MRLLYIGLSERNAMAFWPQYYLFFPAIRLHSKFVLSLEGISLPSPQTLKILAHFDQPLENYSKNK
jgi:hypothetical protein